VKRKWCIQITQHNTRNGYQFVEQALDGWSNRGWKLITAYPDPRDPKILIAIWRRWKKVKK